MSSVDSARRAPTRTDATNRFQPIRITNPRRGAARCARVRTPVTASIVWKLPRAPLTLLLAALILSHCGSVGEPLAPLLNIPERIHDFQARQIQDQLILEWAWPLLTTEGSSLKDVAGFIVYGMPIDNPAEAPTPEAFEQNAAEWRALAGPEIEPYGPGKKLELAIPAAAYIGNTYALAVRVESRRGRRSGLSNMELILVVNPPATPASPAAEMTVEGVALTWPVAERATAYRIYRRGPNDETFQPLGETASAPFNDPAIQWDQTYEYRVRSLAKTSTGITEGGDSPPAKILAKDTFPPAPPRDLRAVVTPTSVELSWRESTAPDLAGYRVFRQNSDAPPTALNDQLLSTPSFSDTAIQPGSAYRYTVTALDHKSNESTPSSTVDARIP